MLLGELHRSRVFFMSRQMKSRTILYWGGATIRPWGGWYRERIRSATAVAAPTTGSMKQFHFAEGGSDDGAGLSAGIGRSSQDAAAN